MSKNNIKLGDISNFIGANSHSTESIVQRKQFVSQIAIDKNDELTILAKLTGDNMDRDNEVVIPEGVDTTDYEENPIVCFNHSYSEPSIGKVIALQTTKDALYGKIKFAPTAKGREIFELIKGGFLNCMSIGFIIKSELIKGTRAFEEYVRDTGLKIDSACKRIITECSMIENSIVPLPSNKEALILGVSSKSITLDLELQKQLGILVEDEMEKKQLSDEELDVAINEAIAKEEAAKLAKEALEKLKADQAEEVTEEEVVAVEVVAEPEVAEAVVEEVFGEGEAETEVPAEVPAEEVPVEDVVEVMEEVADEEPAKEDEEKAEEPEESTPAEEETPEAPEEEVVEEEKAEEDVEEVVEEDPEETEEWKVIREGDYVATDSDVDMAKSWTSGKIC